jgi:NAD(P)-dependent dehydrogenase (short-subunit alcohol dehydrogenase family)
VWDETFDVNVKGVYLMSKHTVPHMIGQGQGSIVNNSSILGLKASAAGFAAYSASKGAVNHSRSMALSTRIRDTGKRRLPRDDIHP